ncbi:major facilitator superfamily domain-containing protein [Fusarium solani]|uniref:Major facilitator superfamily domain-containing protein n=1 Tax=Fusarium solani TaxID=169388 RepID=A0A9P9R8A5_FUSSL|nr:major facilitator superfamily domain-containing protein [Fusarium solani]KAH7268795.1 major facilitator superfamily domain-containing protein [Fusarium solani]
MNRLQLATLCLASLLNGFNDGSLGAILAYMERDYSIGYAVVSLIFIGQGIGCLFAAIFLDDLYPSLSQVNVFRIANMAVVLGYIPIMLASPFPLIPIAFSFVGFGTAFNKMMGKTLCSHFPNKPVLPEILYGSYGIGTTASPLVVTAMAATEGMHWSRFYIINLGLAISVLALSSWSFRCCGKNPNKNRRDLESTAGTTMGDIPQSLCTRTVLLGAILVLAYRGVEASISGWTIAFLIDAHTGKPELLGYVLASFWAGIAVGRFGSSDVQERFGQNYLVYGSIVLASAFQLLVWLMPNANCTTIAAFAVGAMLGPIYPHVAAIFMRPMAERDSSKEMVTITAIGSLGGAIASFLTGLLAQVVGTTVLHPVVITLLTIMLVCWWGIPSTDKSCGLRS